MSNDAHSTSWDVRDERRFPAPWQEPLALKLLRDRMEADDMPTAFRRNCTLFYYALTQVSAMRGSTRFRVYNDQVMDLSYVEEKYFVEIKQYLEKLRLCAFDERSERGSRKRVLCTLLEAPWTELPTASREEGPSDAPSRRRKRSTTCQPQALEATEDSSSVSTHVDTSEQQTAKAGSRKPPRGGRRAETSLRDWTREQIAAHHAASPSLPPPGATVYQAFACAVTTIPGFNERILPLMEGEFKAWWPMLQKTLNQGIGTTVLDYEDWMDGALSFDSAPVPKDGKPAMEYFLGALRDQSYQARVNRFEGEHAERKAGTTTGDGERVSDADMEAILGGCGVRTGR
jgi:hypothetical protein